MNLGVFYNFIAMGREYGLAPAILTNLNSSSEKKFIVRLTAILFP